MRKLYVNSSYGKRSVNKTINYKNYNLPLLQSRKSGNDKQNFK